MSEKKEEKLMGRKRKLIYKDKYERYPYLYLIKLLGKEMAKIVMKYAHPCIQEHLSHNSGYASSWPLREENRKIWREYFQSQLIDWDEDKQFSLCPLLDQYDPSNMVDFKWGKTPIKSYKDLEKYQNPQYKLLVSLYKKYHGCWMKLNYIFPNHGAFIEYPIEAETFCETSYTHNFEKYFYKLSFEILGDRELKNHEKLNLLEQEKLNIDYAKKCIEESKKNRRAEMY